MTNVEIAEAMGWPHVAVHMLRQSDQNHGYTLQPLQVKELAAFMWWQANTLAEYVGKYDATAQLLEQYQTMADSDLPTMPEETEDTARADSVVPPQDEQQGASENGETE